MTCLKNLEASRQIVEHVLPDRHEALLAQLLPGAVHQVEVKHDHAVTVLRLVQVEVTIIEPDMVENLLDKASFPVTGSGALCILSKLQPLHGHIISSGECPENSPFAARKAGQDDFDFNKLLESVGC